jgi:hypothetical protein
MLIKYKISAEKSKQLNQQFSIVTSQLGPFSCFWQSSLAQQKAIPPQ